jgi:TonB family protein
MRKLLLLTVLLILATASFGQTQNWAPVVWERYKISSQHLSFVLPKLPMVAKQSDDCDSRHTSTYYSYAEGAVYEMRLTTRLKDPFCVGLRPRPFGAATLEKRLAELRDAKDKPSESTETVAGKTAYRFERKTSTRLIIVESPDPKWWIELAVAYHASNKPDVDRFFKSLMPKAEGKEIGRGSEFMLGDPATDSQQIVSTAQIEPGSDKAASDDAGSDRYMMLYQPKATYTQKARDADTQGAVRVNITLQANGAVGAVVPVTTLKNGLTEMAVAAAKKMVFLPKRVEGKPVSIIITREYTFTIY